MLQIFFHLILKSTFYNRIFIPNESCQLVTMITATTNNFQTFRTVSLMTKKNLKQVCFNAYSCVLASAIFFCPLFCVAFDRVFKMSSVSCWPYVTYLPCLKFGQVLLYPNIIAMESTLVSMEVANASLNNKIFPLYQLSSCWLISQQPTNDSNDSLDLILLIRAFCAFKTKRLTEKKYLQILDMRVTKGNWKQDMWSRLSWLFGQ